MLKKTKNILTGITLPFALMVTFSSLVTPTASAQQQLTDRASYQLANGVTEPIYNYGDAIKETIFVESTLDTDKDGKPDRVAADIIRPKETNEDLKVPVIMDASPYYNSLGRGNESELKDPDRDGVNDMFPLYYDNYFVPRGYAVVLPDMVGTNNSDGCPPTGGPEEIESVKVVIDWLNGKGKAWDKNGQEITADWSTGKVGMIGKSYDGTLANGAASAGIEGLETIVPIGAISSWYDYYRYGGVLRTTNGPGGLSNTVTNPEKRAYCAPLRDELRIASDDTTGNYNGFWKDRDFVKDADKVKASVFVIHGINDYNVKANNFSNWWEGLAENDVPRKLWLTQTGHVDPFDFRRAEWVDTLHEWFDYWLLDIDNGIMDEPMVDIERAADEWETHSTWPDVDTESVKVRLAPADGDLLGTLQTSPVLGDFTQSFTDNNRQTDTQMAEGEFTAKENRLLFLSPELTGDVRLSGVPLVDIQAIIDKENTNLTALIVDYGTDERVNHRASGEGIRTLTTESCWGESSPVDDACYKEAEKTTIVAPYEIVTHGWMAAKNRLSLETSDLLTPGESYRFQWKTLPEDYVFKKGHRIGIVIAGSNYGRMVANNDKANFQVALGKSNIVLPIVGGKKALDNALGLNGGTSPESVTDMLTIVQHYKDSEEFTNASAARALQTHLTAVELYEKQGASDKVIKHLQGFKTLLDHQLENKLISKEAYQVLTADMDYLVQKWQ
ncbi:Xaa-Pro dipeptidyl-peptidase [Sporosarcina sp. NPDC096371]|uniref:Xaa-Pro dipeptidyl-peptidase n=1 Tax=Sporosarcina sp. NPDC096371 TaxID=3364530 RepID=UPI00381C87FB